MNRYYKAAAVCLLALAQPTLGVAQVEGSALNYMLQRPRVAKQYTHKRAFDHLFIDAGAGANFMGTRHPKAGPEAELNLGDWITPEHGMRLNFNGGAYHIYQDKPKYAEVGLDYLLNITALSQRGNTYSPRKVEFYGIAGIDFTLSRNNGKTAHGLGAHLGLRSQMAMSPYTYFFVEPRIGVQQDDASQAYTWHGYRPVASASLGFGYRLPEAGIRASMADSTQKKWTDGLFVSLAGGPLYFANAHPSSWKHNAGARITLGLGKWFDPYNALRLTAGATTFKQQSTNRVKAFGLQADYLLNLHNAFGGVNPERRFWINAVAGLSWNTSRDTHSTRSNTFGLGAGLQGNVRLSRDINFTLEPRVDAYRNDYAPRLTTAHDWDLTTALLAGLTYTYHDRSATAPAPDVYEQTVWHDHMFVEMGIGGNLPIARSAVKSPFNYLRPQAYVGIGKWFTPVHGLRLGAQLAQTEVSQSPTTRYKHYDFGVDYLLNLTNAFYGYRNDRPFDFTASAGVNLSSREQRKALFFGADAALRATWHVNSFVGIFVEPRLQGYGHRYLPIRSGQDKIDLVASATAGIQFNMHGFDRAVAYDRMLNDGQGLRRSITLAGGASAQANHLRTSGYYAPVGRISYTQSYTPLSAWRANVQAMVRGAVDGQRLMQVKAGADWLTDLTAQTYGYNPSRPLAIRALAGFNIGFDRGGGRTYFAPDFHLGGQMSVRLSDKVHIIAEPQVAYEMSRRFKGERLGRCVPQLLLGLDYSLESHKKDATLSSLPAHQRFVSASMGAGAYTGNFSAVSGFGRKLTFTSDATYGQWLNQLSGFNLGLGNTLAHRNGKGNESITAIHANYMINLLSALSGESTEGQLFQLTGLAGASMGISSKSGRNAKIAPGLQASVQAGFRITPRVELYVEPVASVYTKQIEPSSSRPFEGELKLNVGTKVYF